MFLPNAPKIMKFEAQLRQSRISKWSHHYVDYKALKKVLSIRKAERARETTGETTVDRRRGAPPIDNWRELVVRTSETDCCEWQDESGGAGASSEAGLDGGVPVSGTTSVTTGREACGDSRLCSEERSSEQDGSTSSSKTTLLSLLDKPSSDHQPLSSTQSTDDEFRRVWLCQLQSELDKVQTLFLRRLADLEQAAAVLTQDWVDAQRRCTASTPVFVRPPPRPCHLPEECSVTIQGGEHSQEPKKRERSSSSSSSDGLAVQRFGENSAFSPKRCSPSSSSRESPSCSPSSSSRDHRGRSSPAGGGRRPPPVGEDHSEEDHRGRSSPAGGGRRPPPVGADHPEEDHRSSPAGGGRRSPPVGEDHPEEDHRSAPHPPPHEDDPGGRRRSSSCGGGCESRNNALVDPQLQRKNLERRVGQLLQRAESLRDFSSLNYLAFYKITKKYENKFAKLSPESQSHHRGHDHALCMH